MTCRLQQDPLERFFGMVRSAGGCNADPDPILFAQTFRLLTVYSLVEPPQGSNIGKGDMLQSLLQKKNLNSNEQQPDVMELFDAIFDAGDHLYEADVESTASTNDNLTTTDDHVKSYIAGYVVRKIKKMTNCEACITSVHTPEATLNRDELILLKSRGGLMIPSKELFTLISRVENIITEVLESTPLNNETLFNIINAVQRSHLPTIGCDKCEDSLSIKVVRFYIIMRLHFACRRFNASHNQKKEKAKLLRKQSRLT